MPNTILLLGRTKEQLGEHETRQILHRYGEDVEFVTTKPGTEEEHLADCKRIKPDAVLLPSDMPIFAKAVREGHEHIVYASGRKSEWGLYVVWNLVRYPFRSFFRAFPAELAYFNNRPK